MLKVTISEEELLYLLHSSDRADRNKALNYLYSDKSLINAIRKKLSLFNRLHIEPEEILQTGLIKLDELARRGTFRRESTVKTFLIGICEYIIRDYKKNKKIDTLDDYKISTKDGDYDFEGFIDKKISILETIILKEPGDSDFLTEKVKSYIIQLAEKSTKCGEILTLSFFQGYDAEEIAKIRGQSKGVQVRKGLDECREKLGKIIMNEPKHIFDRLRKIVRFDLKR